MDLASDVFNTYPFFPLYSWIFLNYCNFIEGTAYFYVNGTITKSVAQNMSTDYVLDTFYIGRYVGAGVDSLNSSHPSIEFYTSALTSAEVTSGMAKSLTYGMGN